jgi:hypothetical protein
MKKSFMFERYSLENDYLYRGISKSLRDDLFSKYRKHCTEWGWGGVSSAHSFLARECEGAVLGQLPSATQAVVHGLLLPELHQRPLAH